MTREIRVQADAIRRAAAQQAQRAQELQALIQKLEIGLRSRIEGRGAPATDETEAQLQAFLAELRQEAARRNTFADNLRRTADLLEQSGRAGVAALARAA